MGGTRSTFEGEEWHIQDFGGKTEEMGPLAIHRRGGENNIKWIFRKLDLGYGLDQAG